MPRSELETEHDQEDTLDAIGSQLGTYEKQLRGYLRSLDAKVDSYHFTVEKHDGGMTIDVAIRTTIKPKKNEGE